MSLKQTKRSFEGLRFAFGGPGRLCGPKSRRLYCRCIPTATTTSKLKKETLMYIVKQLGAILLTTTVILTTTVFAQQSSSSTKKVIVGSWVETVTFDGGFMPPLKSLVTFSADGTLTVADQGNVNLSAGQLF